jgi:hypothetical protein
VSVVPVRGWGAVASFAVCVAGCDRAFDLVTVVARDGGDGAEDAEEADAQVVAQAMCLDDTFEGIAFGPPWTTYGAPAGVTVRVVSGGAEIEVPATVTPSTPYGGFSTPKRRFTGTAVEAEIVLRPPDTAPSELTMQLTIDATNHYRMTAQGGMLTYGVFDQGVPDEASIAYDTTAHRFVRMQHDKATNEMVFEAGSTSSLFVEIARVAATVPVEAAYFEIYAGSYSISPGFVGRVDNAKITGDCKP